MSKFIQTFLIGIALLGMSAEAHAQDQIDCFQCVDTRDIAPAAITTGKIKHRAVTTGKLAPRAVTTGKIKNGAVTINKVSPELSNAIGMFCLPDETVVGMDVNGNFSCEVPQTLASDDLSNTRAGKGALINTTGPNNTAAGRPRKPIRSTTPWLRHLES